MEDYTFTMFSKPVRRSEPKVTPLPLSDRVRVENHDANRTNPILGWCRDHTYSLTHCTLGLIFVWFGGLKLMGLSPATELVKQTFFFLPGGFIVPFLGALEVVIGGCFLVKKTVGLALVMLAFHLPGTFLSFLVVPERCFVHFPFALTTEGEFILKNLVIISAAISLAGSLRAKSNRETMFPVIKN